MLRVYVPENGWLHIYARTARAALYDAQLILLDGSIPIGGVRAFINYTPRVA